MKLKIHGPNREDLCVAVAIVGAIWLASIGVVLASNADNPVSATVWLSLVFLQAPVVLGVLTLSMTIAALRRLLDPEG